MNNRGNICRHVSTAGLLWITPIMLRAFPLT